MDHIHKKMLDTWNWLLLAKDEGPRALLAPLVPMPVN